MTEFASKYRTTTKMRGIIATACTLFATIHASGETRKREWRSTSQAIRRDIQKNKTSAREENKKFKFKEVQFSDAESLRREETLHPWQPLIYTSGRPMEKEDTIVTTGEIILQHEGPKITAPANTYGAIVDKKENYVRIRFDTLALEYEDRNGKAGKRIHGGFQDWRNGCMPDAKHAVPSEAKSSRFNISGKDLEKIQFVSPELDAGSVEERISSVSSNITATPAPAAATPAPAAAASATAAAHSRRKTSVVRGHPRPRRVRGGLRLPNRRGRTRCGPDRVRNEPKAGTTSRKPQKSDQTQTDAKVGTDANVGPDGGSVGSAGKDGNPGRDGKDGKDGKDGRIIGFVGRDTRDVVAPPVIVVSPATSDSDGTISWVLLGLTIFLLICVVVLLVIHFRSDLKQTYAVTRTGSNDNARVADVLLNMLLAKLAETRNNENNDIVDLENGDREE